MQCKAVILKHCNVYSDLFLSILWYIWYVLHFCSCCLFSFCSWAYALINMFFAVYCWGLSHSYDKLQLSEPYIGHAFLIFQVCFFFFANYPWILASICNYLWCCTCKSISKVFHRWCTLALMNSAGPMRDINAQVRVCLRNCNFTPLRGLIGSLLATDMTGAQWRQQFMLPRREIK